MVIIMNDRMRIVGKNIKVLRKNSLLSQGNLALFLNVDQSYVSKIENGERIISSDMLEKISELFGVTVENIMTEASDFKAISFALRADQIGTEDLETIRSINKLALNLNFMQNLIEEVKSHG